MGTQPANAGIMSIIVSCIVLGLLGQEDVALPNIPDQPWVNNAILDVAYFLRRFKFSGKDERYQSNSSGSSLYKTFPDPPLRSIHWQVRRHCDDNFEDCLKYIWSRFNDAGFTLTKENNIFQNDRFDRYKFNDKENQMCLEQLQEDENNLRIFKNNLERFQWLASSRYFMCWYTLKKVAALEHFGESCDNFAACLDKKGKYENGDIRARDATPFSCAFHSFCPDPCCGNRVLTSEEECVERACSEAGPCAVNFDDNLDWDLMIRNYWNVSCTCQQQGLRWSSQSGLCIDIDECYEQSHSCHPDTESCINVLGTYHCICTFGFTRSRGRSCENDTYLESILYQDTEQRDNEKSWLDKYKSWANNFWT